MTEKLRNQSDHQRILNELLDADTVVFCLPLYVDNKKRTCNEKLYEKNELTFAIVWIVIDCVLQSLANWFNEVIGIEYSASSVLCILQSIILMTIKNHIPG